MAADTAARENAVNARGLWAALAGTPAQTVQAPGPVRVATTRDRANLVNVEVESGGQWIGFVYDTGANLSTVTASTAREMGFRVLRILCAWAPSPAQAAMRAWPWRPSCASAGRCGLPRLTRAVAAGAAHWRARDDCADGARLRRADHR